MLRTHAATLALAAAGALGLALAMAPRRAPQAPAPPAMPKMPSGGMAMPQTLVCPLWRTSPTLVAKIHIKNALMVAPLPVTVTLYMADGTPYELPPVTIPMSGEVTVNLNHALESAPPSLGGHVSSYGSASLTYMWDGAGHVSASMNLKDLAHSLTFHQAFVDLPASADMAPGMAGLTGFERVQVRRERMVLASYHVPTPGASRERPPQMQTPPLNGLWWKRDPGVAGFFAVSNTSSSPIQVRYRVTGSAGAGGLGSSVGLGPNATAVVPLDPLIASLPAGQRNGGGIVIEQLSGPAMAVAAAGWLENEREGFSASIEFQPGYMPQSAAPTTASDGPGSTPSMPPVPPTGPVVLAATGLMLGKPMSSSGFPEQVRFRPYGYLRNVSRRPIAVTVSANVAMTMMGTPGASTPQPVSRSFRTLLPPGALVPVALAPLARDLERELARTMNVDPASLEDAMLNWSVTFPGHAGNVLMTTGSTDQTGNYVFEVMPNRVTDAVGLQLPYWNTARGNDTMYSLWNPGAMAQNVVLTLYSADGMHTYAIPVTLAPGASAMVDIGMLRQEGMPDPSGNLIPPGVLDGSAMLEPAAAGVPGKNGMIEVPASGPAQMQVAVSVGIFNPETATCCGMCIYCCFYTNPDVASLIAAVGANAASTFCMEDCCGILEDLTYSAAWTSGNSSILGSDGSGQFTGVGVGGCEMTAEAYLESHQASGPYCTGGCKSAYQGGSNTGTVTQCGDPPSPSSGDRGALIAEYQNDGVAWIPSCSSFVDASEYQAGAFTFAQLTTDDQYSWAVLTGYFVTNINETSSAVAGSGLSLAITSGYRNPQSEYSIDTSEGFPFYKNSRHEYGDGVDFKTPAGQTDYGYIQAADWSVNIDNGIGCVEPFEAIDPHAHVDWRTDASAEDRSSVCPTTNGVSWGKP